MVEGNSISNLYNSLYTHQSTLASLEETRNKLMTKVAASAGKDDTKSVIVELNFINNQIQQEQYAETTRKLEEQQLSITEAATKNRRKKIETLKAHENRLFNESMGKLMLAKEKVSATGNDGISTQQAEEVNHNIRESEKLGIEAAEVARKRFQEEIKDRADKKKKQTAVNIKM